MAQAVVRDASLRAAIAAHIKHSRYDPRKSTAPARAAFLSRFEELADPTGELPEAERFRRAHHLRRAHFLRLSLKSAQARRRRANQGKQVAR